MKICASVFLMLLVYSSAIAADANAARRQRIFGACAACHSLQTSKNMTGPSLAGIWDRKAGSLASFSRYSDALKSSGVTWDDQTLDAWITAPEQSFRATR
jgi:cytochrome c